jgi:hypothetical protein
MSAASEQVKAARAALAAAEAEAAAEVAAADKAAKAVLVGKAKMTPWERKGWTKEQYEEYLEERETKRDAIAVDGFEQVAGFDTSLVRVFIPAPRGNGGGATKTSKRTEIMEAARGRMVQVLPHLHLGQMFPWTPAPLETDSDGDEVVDAYSTGYIGNALAKVAGEVQPTDAYGTSKTWGWKLAHRDAIEVDGVWVEDESSPWYIFIYYVDPRHAVRMSEENAARVAALLANEAKVTKITPPKSTRRRAPAKKVAPKAS